MHFTVAPLTLRVLIENSKYIDLFLRLPKKSFNKELHTFFFKPSEIHSPVYQALQKSALKTKAYQSAFIQCSYLAIHVLSQCHFRRNTLQKQTGCCSVKPGQRKHILRALYQQRTPKRCERPRESKLSNFKHSVIIMKCFHTVGGMKQHYLPKERNAMVNVGIKENKFPEYL